MAKPLVKINDNIPEPFYQIDRGKIEQKSPVIGITYLQADDNKYGLKAVFKKEKEQKGSAIKILNDFLVKAKQYETIDKLVSAHISHKKAKNCDAKSISMMKKIQRDFNVETADMIHIHCKPGGKGEFVLHGFVIHNCFEIVWFDPKHEIHR